jgi:fluoride exporter
MQMIKTILLVGFGGALGSLARLSMNIFAHRYFSTAFPMGTFLTNISGCLLIGVLIGFLQKNDFTSDDFRLFSIVGFCGAYTTFSTFSSENIALMQNGNVTTAMIYIGGSVLTGLAAVWFGLYLMR